VPSIRYGISPWLDAVPVKKRPDFPSFRGVITHPVVVVGGGMSGAMTAYACAAAGLKVILLEAERVGLGGSGYATGLMSGESSESYRDVEARAGKRVARALFSALESAPRDLAAAVKRLGIKARIDVAPAIRIVPLAQSDKALR
jgi:glycine/D-amino acid oxidase-like deaminating enzyme